jgi:hypothetical protein
VSDSKPMTESQLSICTWADATFGPPASDASIAARALVEMAELVTACVNGEPVERIGEEIADVVIVLARLGRSMGADVMWHVLFCVDDDPGEPATASAVEQIGRLMICLECGDGIGAWAAFSLLCESLATASCQRGINLQVAIDAKMAINRARRWVLDGRGHGSHVREVTP